MSDTIHDPNSRKMFTYPIFSLSLAKIELLVCHVFPLLKITGQIPLFRYYLQTICRKTLKFEDQVWYCSVTSKLVCRYISLKDYNNKMNKFKFHQQKMENMYNVFLQNINLLVLLKILARMIRIHILSLLWFFFSSLNSHFQPSS